MASREELQLLREARAGNAQSQCELGKLYLFGSKSLPQSLPTALHWLSRAALQENTNAKLLIGNHIPYEMAKAYPDRHKQRTAGINHITREMEKQAIKRIGYCK